MRHEKAPLALGGCLTWAAGIGSGPKPPQLQKKSVPSSAGLATDVRVVDGILEDANIWNWESFVLCLADTGRKALVAGEGGGYGLGPLSRLVYDLVRTS